MQHHCVSWKSELWRYRNEKIVRKIDPWTTWVRYEIKNGRNVRVVGFIWFWNIVIRWNSRYYHDFFIYRYFSRITKFTKFTWMCLLPPSFFSSDWIPSKDRRPNLTTFELENNYYFPHSKINKKKKIIAMWHPHHHYNVTTKICTVKSAALDHLFFPVIGFTVCKYDLQMPNYCFF